MTFSMLGRCGETGQLGAVVTTSAMAVGSRCAHARAGVGAALTQHRTDPRLGTLALGFLAQGFTAAQALDGVVAATPDRAWRQLATIDAEGRTAAFTGASVRAAHGEAHGRGCIAIGNILANGAVPRAMADAFEAAPGRLAARLVAAILVGEAAGGETAAVQSAHLLVVDRESFPFVDLRVDEHPAPLAELARLWALYAPQAEDYVLRAVAPDRAAGWVPPPPKA